MGSLVLQVLTDLEATQAKMEFLDHKEPPVLLEQTVKEVLQE